MTTPYQENASDLNQVQSSQGFLLLEFGANWCGHCISAKSLVEEALQSYNNIKHIKEQDGPGKRLGRYFQVKLWPTLILLKDGEELGRLIRPTTSTEVQNLLALTH